MGYRSAILRAKLLLQRTHGKIVENTFKYLAALHVHVEDHGSTF
jgi:hypothetical protein